MLFARMFSIQSDLEEIDLENGGGDDLNDENKEKLAEYYRETDAILKAIDKIHENVEIIESRYRISLNGDMEESDKATATDDIACLLERTEKTSEAVRKRLRRIAGENKIFRSEHPEKTGTLRIRVNTHQNLTRRFMDAMQLFEESQERHRDNIREAVERQLRVMNPQATEEEIQDALRNGRMNEVVDDSPTFTQLPVEEQLRLKNGLEDLRCRNKDIKKLEESIIQLHQLFVDMQILVEAQGELLNEIEYNIVDTKEKAEAGYHELVEARAHQRSATRKKICIAFLIIAIIVVIAVPILIKYIPIWFPETAEVIDNLPIVGGGSNSTETTDRTTGAESVEQTEIEAGGEAETKSGTGAGTRSGAGSATARFVDAPVDAALATTTIAQGHEPNEELYDWIGFASVSRQIKLNNEAVDASKTTMDLIIENSGGVDMGSLSGEFEVESFERGMGVTGSYVPSEGMLDVLLEFIRSRIGREIAKLTGDEEVVTADEGDV